jgi:hypothetical protein
MEIPFLSWKLLNPGAQATICEAHQAENLQGKGGDANAVVPSNLQNANFKNPEDKKGKTKSEGVPWQHSNPADRMSNKTEKEKDETEDAGEKTLNEDPDEMNEHESWTKLMNTVKDVTQLKNHATFMVTELLG